VSAPRYNWNAKPMLDDTVGVTGGVIPRAADDPGGAST